MRIVGMREAGGKTILESARPVEITRVPSAEARADEEAAPAARDERDVRRRRAGEKNRRALGVENWISRSIRGDAKTLFVFYLKKRISLIFSRVQFLSVSFFCLFIRQWSAWSAPAIIFFVFSFVECISPFHDFLFIFSCLEYPVFLYKHKNK